MATTTERSSIRTHRRATGQVHQGLDLLRRGWRRIWRPGAAALVALAGMALLTVGPAAAAHLWDLYAEQQATVQTPHQVGDPVPAGAVTFVVHEVRCGHESEHSQRCEILLGARNDGSEELTVPRAAQTMHIRQGARHLPTGGSGRFGTLAPQQAATVVIQFKLPQDVTVTHVEVRPGMYSQGVPIAVGDPYPLVGGGNLGAPARPG